MNAEQALSHLLPLLLPPGPGDDTRPAGPALVCPGWVGLAAAHDLQPAFYVFLRARGIWEEIPAEVQDALERAYTFNLARYLAASALLREVLEQLTPCARLPVLLKGLAYAEELYPDPAGRAVGDLDLLVGREDFEACVGRLRDSGLDPVTPKPRARGLPGVLERLTRKKLRGDCPVPVDGVPGADGAEVVFRTHVGEQEFLIELHARLINLRAGGGKEQVFRSDEDGDWTIREVVLSCGKIGLLSREDTFVHGLRHLALHHRLIGHRWHQDLGLMLCRWRGGMDPRMIATKAAALNSTKVLAVELALLRDMFGAGVAAPSGEEGWPSCRTTSWDYRLFRRVARGGRRTPMRELVRTLLAPSWKDQLRTWQ